MTATIAIPAAPQQEMSRPSGVAVDPTAGTVYVINGSDGTWGAVSVIDVATNALTATISLPTVPYAAGSDPTGVAVDPAAGTVYVPTPGNGTVSVIDEAANAVTATVPFGMALHSVGVAVDPAAGTVYLTMGGAVSLLDAATNAVTATISLPVGSGISGVAVDPAAGTVYLANDGHNTVSVLAPGQAPAITSADSASIGMRSPADVTVTATGIPAPAIAETGALPAGITLTDNGNGTAALSGTAAAGTAGSYPITITAANGVGSPATQAFTLHVTTAASAPAITSAPAAAATFGAVLGFTVTTNGYPLPRISKTGTLPPGVHFAGNGDGTATISGIPARTALGPYTVTLTAGNKAGKATQSFTLTIWKAPAIAKVPATTATIGTPMHLAITAAGYNTPALTETGTLPKGLRYTSTGNGQAAITGTPAKGTAGSRAITITAANQIGTTSRTFTLTVHRPGAHRH